MASEIKVDTISEKTSANGVSIDSVVHKDSAIYPSSADGGALGSASNEWSDLFLADSSVIKFGADQDTTLTHTDGTGLTLNSTNKLCFNDASQYIQGASNAILDIAATDEIELTATLVDVNANLDVSGTYTGAGLMTTGGNIVIPNAGNIGSASDTDAIAIASNGVTTFSQAPVFPDGSIAVADLDIDGGTDIGAAIVDADLFIIDDGAGGTNRKVTASRVKTYAASAGKMGGNIVTATRADDTSITTTSYADTNCTVAITPSAADSKILVHISIPTWIYRGGYVSCRYGAKINRAISGGSTTALVTSGAANNLGGRLSDSPGNDDDVGVMFNYTLLDSPSTTSATTYSVQFALDNADGTSYVIANVSDTTSYMTAIEVLA